MRDIACIKPTIENTDPAFAVGMQASCLVRDGTACGTVPMRRKRWLHKAAKRIPTLWIRKGFQSTLYTARRVFCFDDWIFLCNIQNKCACAKQICILISSLQRFAGEKMFDTDSACFIPHCKSASFLLKNTHSFERCSKGQSYVGYGVTRLGCTVFLLFTPHSWDSYGFLPLRQ